MSDHAKLLLSAYRPGGADATDPAFAEALAQAQRDPALRAWLEESQAFDRAVAGRLGAVPVPAELRATILAGAKFSEPRRWWQTPKFLALAAMLVVLAALAAFWTAAHPLEKWQTVSLAVLDGLERGDVQLDTEHSEPARLVDWLNSRSAPAPAALPLLLAQNPSLGCKTIDSRGRRISLICFDLGNKEQAHFFTTPRMGLRFAPPDRQPTFGRLRNWNIASWSDGGQVHMLASEIAPERLRTLVPEFVAARREARTGIIAEWVP